MSCIKPPKALLWKSKLYRMGGHCMAAYKQHMNISWGWRWSVVISWEDYTWPGVRTNQYCSPCGVQSGVILWGEPRPSPTSICPGDMRFPWHTGMIANPFHQHSQGQSQAPQWVKLQYLEVSSKQDFPLCLYLSNVIIHHIHQRCLCIKPYPLTVQQVFWVKPSNVGLQLFMSLLNKQLTEMTEKKRTSWRSSFRLILHVVILSHTVTFLWAVIKLGLEPLLSVAPILSSWQ